MKHGHSFFPFSYPSTLAAALVLALGACSQQTPPQKADASAPASAVAGQNAGGRRLVLAIKGEPEQGFDPISGWGRYGNPLFQSTLLKRNEKLDLEGDLAPNGSCPKTARPGPSPFATA